MKSDKQKLVRLPITVRVPSENASRIQRYVNKTGIPLSTLIRKMIEAYMIAYDDQI